MKPSVLSSALLGLATSAMASTIRYTTETGYFLQDEASTDSSVFDYVGTAHLHDIELDKLMFIDQI